MKDTDTAMNPKRLRALIAELDKYALHVAPDVEHELYDCAAHALSAIIRYYDCGDALQTDGLLAPMQDCLDRIRALRDRPLGT